MSIPLSPYRMLVLISSVLAISACGGGAGQTASSNDSRDVVGGAAVASNPAPVAIRTASLSWTAPTTRSDTAQTPVVPSEIGGYRIYYGNDSTHLQLLKEVADPSQTTLTTQDLAPGTYYFAVTAYDSFGTESAYSNIETKQII